MIMDENNISLADCLKLGIKGTVRQGPPPEDMEMLEMEVSAILSSRNLSDNLKQVVQVLWNYYSSQSSRSLPR